MNATLWLAEELSELHRHFLEMRQTEPESRRRELAFQVVLLPGSTDRLERACLSAQKQRRYFGALEDEVLEEAIVLLSRWIAAAALRFEERGEAPFAGWYWALCQSAARRAVEKLAPPPARPIESLDGDKTPLVSPPSIVEVWWDEVVQAIAQIPSLRTQAVMADLAADVPAWKTAEECGISASDVSKERSKGIAFLQRRFRLLVRDAG